MAWTSGLRSAFPVLSPPVCRSYLFPVAGDEDMVKALKVAEGEVKFSAWPAPGPASINRAATASRGFTLMTRSESQSEDRAAAGRFLFDRGGGLDGALRSQLDEAGFLVLEDVMSEERLDALRRRVAELYDREADRAGAEFKQEPGCLRLANLVDKGAVFERSSLSPASWPVSGTCSARDSSSAA